MFHSLVKFLGVGVLLTKQDQILKSVSEYFECEARGSEGNCAVITDLVGLQNFITIMNGIIPLGKFN